MTDEELRTLAKYIAEELQTLVINQAPPQPAVHHAPQPVPAAPIDGQVVFDYEQMFG